MILSFLAFLGNLFLLSPPKAKLLIIDGLQAVAGKQLSRNEVDLIGQRWTASVNQGAPQIDYNGITFQIMEVPPQQIWLVNQLGNKLTPPPQTPSAAGLFPINLPYAMHLTRELVEIPGGEFEMGSPVWEPGRLKDEARRKVRVSPFRVMRSLLTRTQWLKLTGALPVFHPWIPEEERRDWFSCMDCPMTFVSWKQLQLVFEQLSRCGIHFRFLKEAEAEYLLRASGDLTQGRIEISRTSYPWGDEPAALTATSWFNETSLGRPHPVGLKPVNLLPLTEVRGNVFTWTGEAYPVEPIFPPSPKQLEFAPKVVRGGGWGSDAATLRSAYRGIWRSDDSNHMIGIRLAYDTIKPDIPI